LTEDIYFLDTHAEVFVWVGQCVEPKEKQTVFEIGQVTISLSILLLVLLLFLFLYCLFIETVYEQKYIDLAGSLEGLHPKVPIYKINEGNEPCFFTTYFSWDATKAIVSDLVLKRDLDNITR